VDTGAVESEYLVEPLEDPVPAKHELESEPVERELVEAARDPGA
jgi:hypothetical protein